MIILTIAKEQHSQEQQKKNENHFFLVYRNICRSISTTFLGQLRFHDSLGSRGAHRCGGRCGHPLRQGWSRGVGVLRNGGSLQHEKRDHKMIKHNFQQDFAFQNSFLQHYSSKLCMYIIIYIYSYRVRWGVVKAEVSSSSHGAMASSCRATESFP